MNPKLLIENSTIKERIKWFQDAYIIARTEYGELEDESKLNLQKYIYGEKQLDTVERMELKRFSRDYGKLGSGKIPFWDNKLNIINKRYVKRACCSIVTMEIMKLDAESVEAYDWEYYKNIHHRLYKKLFDWGGEVRNINYEQQQEVLENEVFRFTEITEISIKLRDSFNRMEKFIDRTNIEKSLTMVFDQLGITEWEQMTINEKLSELLLCIGRVWEIHPFIHGNVFTELYFILKFCEEHGFPCDRKTILEYANEDMLLRKCVILAIYDPNWFGRILLLAVTRRKESELKQAQENSNGRRKISFAQMEKIVTEGKNKQMMQQAQAAQSESDEDEDHIVDEED